MPRIYVIDDDKDLLTIVKSLLLKKGFNVSTFHDWRIAQAAIRSSEPQLILLDVFLSDIDGLDICRKLKTSPFTKHIPILMFSAFPKMAETAIHDYGADDFIPKPFEMTDLIIKVHSVLAKKGEWA